MLLCVPAQARSSDYLWRWAQGYSTRNTAKWQNKKTVTLLKTPVRLLGKQISNLAWRCIRNTKTHEINKLLLLKLTSFVLTDHHRCRVFSLFRSVILPSQLTPLTCIGPARAVNVNGPLTMTTHLTAGYCFRKQ